MRAACFDGVLEGSVEFDDEEMCHQDQYDPMKAIGGGDSVGLQDIIDTQNSSGIFKWHETLENVLKMDLEEVTKIKPAISGLSLDVWITTLVLTYLEIKMKDHRDLWELVADKAKKIARRELNKEMDDVLEKAKAIVTRI